jgi:hypothetical protein
MKTFDIPKSGKLHKVVAFKSRFGQCERTHTKSAKPPTKAQCDSQAVFGKASSLLATFTDEQLDAWREAGKKVRSHPRGGQSGPLTAQNFLTAINSNQALIGLEPLLYPPERPVFAANPVNGFSITLGKRGIALKLSVAKTPTAPILVYASRPYNASRRYCDKFRYLGLLRAPVRGQIDIAEQYLRRYAPPWPGSRIILLTVQQLNGWRDTPRRIEAVFRPNQTPVAPPKRRPATLATP